MLDGDVSSSAILAPGDYLLHNLQTYLHQKQNKNKNKNKTKQNKNVFK